MDPVGITLIVFLVVAIFYFFIKKSRAQKSGKFEPKP
uniref:Uncharacterized protein n=1 Tax=viral metagenome TaxID=1070528 RepID=A0A6C0EZ89_9ZZZZ